MHLSSFRSFKKFHQKSKTWQSGSKRWTALLLVAFASWQVLDDEMRVPGQEVSSSPSVCSALNSVLSSSEGQSLSCFASEALPRATSDCEACVKRTDQTSYKTLPQNETLEHLEILFRLFPDPALLRLESPGLSPLLPSSPLHPSSYPFGNVSEPRPDVRRWRDGLILPGA